MADLMSLVQFVVGKAPPERMKSGLVSMGVLVIIIAVDTIPVRIFWFGIELVKRTAERMLEFFAARIRNRNTRKAYARATGGFTAWCTEHGIKELRSFR